MPRTTQTGDVTRMPLQGGYATTFADRRRTLSEVPSPRSDRAEGKKREPIGWNKSVRTSSARSKPTEGNISPRRPGPTSPTTIRRFHSPRAEQASSVAAEPTPSGASVTNSFSATGPSWQTRSLFMSAEEVDRPAASSVNVAAATAAPTAWSASAQAALVQQLRDVVVKLSQGAAAETQEAVNVQKRFEAYTELVHEQDRIINDLRADNARLQRERDTLLAFRHQNLQRDMRLLSGHTDEHASLTKTPMLDELVQLEFAKSNGVTQGAASSMLQELLSQPIRNLVRSLAAQLYDERTRRLDVEEKSSLLVGQQQSMIDTLEQRLRRSERSPQRTPRLTARLSSVPPSTTPRVFSGAGVATPRRGDLDSPTLSSSTSSSHSASQSDTPQGTSYARRHADPVNTAERRVARQLAQQLESPPRSTGASRWHTTPPLSPRSADKRSMHPRSSATSATRTSVPLDTSSSADAYEDASTILAAIRQKYGL